MKHYPEALKDFFGVKECKNMSDRDWETYQILTKCCNSLNATYGSLMHNIGKAARKESFETAVVPISIIFARSITTYLENAQLIIMMMLDETGRLKDFEEFENARNRTTEN